MGPGIVTLDDFCVFYQKILDDLTDAQLSYCHKCGLQCSSCPQVLRGVMYI